MKKTSKQLVAGLAMAVLVAGCATLGGGASDEELIFETIGKLETALLALDIDGLMVIVSEDFEHPEVGDKEDLRGLLEMGLDTGQAEAYVEDGDVSWEDAEITYEDDGTAVVYPVDAEGPPGAISCEIILKKHDKDWYILTINPDGV